MTSEKAQEMTADLIPWWEIRHPLNYIRPVHKQGSLLCFWFFLGGGVCHSAFVPCLGEALSAITQRNKHSNQEKDIALLKFA